MMNPKQLNDLLSCLNPLRVVGETDKMITDVVNDSRQATEGTLFVAVRGVAVDAHRFIGDVIAQGATAVVCEQLPDQINDLVTYIQVEDSTIALAHLADAWFDRPSRALKLVGVTGTNGKTTTATLLYELTQRLGYKAGLLSTVRNMIGNEGFEAKQTTPDHLTLNRLLHEMVMAGCDYAFMEVSSHACSQHRIDGLTFAGGVFTNLTRDHLDFHKTVDNYIAAKKMFFDALPADAFALVNADDKVGAVMLQNCKAKKMTYSLRAMADYRCRIIEQRLDGTALQINGKDVEVMFTGRFNAYNLLCVYGVATQLGFNPDEVLVAMSQLKAVDGRFQTFASPRGYTAIVDYAHTPDALANVLSTVADVVSAQKGHIIAVCGCGGNRDAGKRPIMAAEAAKRSDRVILTSDNPRDEDPEEILNQMEAGLTDDMRPRVLRITDRAQAIRTACALAQPGDVVVVAGKGHETYQEIKGVKRHFDDREVINEVFNNENGN